jgi:hypothetical protein
MFRPHLTPAQHVARREALAQIARGSDLWNGVVAIKEQIILPIGEQFFKGHRLVGPEYARTLSRIRGILGGFGPSIMNETQRLPTRTRPKGEEHEFTTLSRAPGESGYELVGVQLHLSRRRIGYSFDGTGTFITRHLMERSIERGLASWTGRLSEVEEAVLDTMGLAAVWRHAYESGLTRERAIALPYGQSLIYGIMNTQAEPRGNGTIGFTGSRYDYTDADPNPFLAHPAILATGSTDIVLRTAIDDDLMSLAQCDLRDDLARFVAANEPLLSEIRHGSLWRRSVLTPARPYEEILPELDGLARRLVTLLSAPDAQVALRGRKADAQDPPPRDEGLRLRGPR